MHNIEIIHRLITIKENMTSLLDNIIQKHEILLAAEIENDLCDIIQVLRKRQKISQPPVDWGDNTRKY